MMDRLQKKCVVASTAAHLVLAGVLFVGPAFVASTPNAPEIQMIDFIPDEIIEGVMAGGGNPNAGRVPVVKPPEIKPPQPPSPPPRVLPEPEPQPKAPKAEPSQPRPPVQEVKNNAPDPDSLEPREKAKSKPKINTQLKTRPKTGSKTAAKSPSEAESAAERRAAETRRRLAGDLRQMATSLKAGTAPAVSVEVSGSYGPGGGGRTFAGYDSLVQSRYFHAWVPSEDIANDRAVTWASVTIDRDGTVLNFRITSKSGDPNMEESVLRALEKVKFIAPFPEGTTDKERTYKIKFDLTAKRLS